MQNTETPPNPVIPQSTPGKSTAMEASASNPSAVPVDAVPHNPIEVGAVRGKRND